MDVRFDIIKLSEAVYERLADGKALSAFFDKTHLSDVRIRPRVMRQKISVPATGGVKEVELAPRLTTGEAALSGLTEARGLKGLWAITIDCHGEIDELWRGFSASAAASIDMPDSFLYVCLDGGGLSADMVVEAVGRLTMAIEAFGSSEAVIDSAGNVPVEVYYRPPLNFYDDFSLSEMDGDTLSQLERRLID